MMIIATTSKRGSSVDGEAAIGEDETEQLK